MIFIDNWSLFGDYFVLFYQVRVIEVWPLFKYGLYSEVVFNTGLPVYVAIIIASASQYNIFQNMFLTFILNCPKLLS